MSSREKELIDLQSYIGKVDTEVTIILQQLQWNTSYLIQKPMVNCKYNTNHRIPIDCRDAHENQCILRSNGYSNEDILLPDPMDPNVDTLIKLNKNDIKLIIDKAAKADPSFKKGSGSESIEPFTLARLQATYTADERRAIHDAVVNAAPSCHDLTDLTLLSNKGEEQKNAKQKTRLEILSELRDMKRRCTKYRGAAGKRRYSDILRDVIKTQMEVYTDVKEEQAVRKQQETQNKLHVMGTKNDYHATGGISENRDRHGEQDKSKHKPRRDGRSYGRSSHSGDSDRYTKQGERFDKYSHRQKSSKCYSDEFGVRKDEGNHKRRRKHEPEKRPYKDDETKRQHRLHDIDESNCIARKEKHFESNTDILTDIHIRKDRDNSYSYKRSGKRDKSSHKADKYAHRSKTTRKYSGETCKEQKDNSYETCSSSYKNRFNETKYSNNLYKYRYEKNKDK